MSGAALWLAAVALLLGGMIGGVGSWQRLLPALLVVAATIGAVQRAGTANEGMTLAIVIGGAVILGALLRLWGLALQPLLVLAAVPFPHGDDADGVSPWVYTAIDSTAFVLPGLLLAGAVASGISEYRRARTAAD